MNFIVVLNWVKNRFMKRTSFISGIILFVVFAFGSAKAQVIVDDANFKKEFGLKFGINYQYVDGSPWTPKLSPGFMGGFYKNWVKEKTGFRIEALLSQAQYSTIYAASYFPPDGKRPIGSYTADWDTVHKGDFNVIYFRLPVLAEFRVFKSLYFFLGPEYSYQLNISDNNGAFSKDYGKTGGLSSLFSTSELYADAGIEGKIKQRLNLAVRFSLGLTSINKSSASINQNNLRSYDNWNIWSLQFTVGMKLKSNEL